MNEIKIISNVKDNLSKALIQTKTRAAKCIGPGEGYSSKKSHPPSDGKKIKFYPWYCFWINHFYSWWVL